MDYKKLPFLILAWIAATLIGATIGTTIREHECQLRIDNMPQTRDTVEIRDTAYIPVPIPIKETVTRTVTVTLPADTTVDVKTPDSVAVVLPVVQKEYADSNYHAWISGGGFASLDSIRIFQRQKYITHTIYETASSKKNKNWGIGVQAGYGWNGRGFSPYVGVGVTYTLWGW